ncbi:uncharacterized protein LOC117891403 [Drosophila subobscura]|uniref:uncharacterized protein LOC117891403 n=1 Tax=Drosophila subobscura TaxID=7241 RepID=UPI00155A9F50|nr:uncharacterized protein LOC117891403 [Drosophila subobscura]XP_034652740.1 uncharacterized protein LOC117891403 [Drosophila subobscura]
MMEALDQQQAKLTSNIDAGDAGGTSARVGLDVGAGAASGTTSEEEDYEDTHNALGLAKEESTMEHSDNNNADAADDAECVRRKRKKSTDDVIDLTLANGQDSSQMEAEAEPESADSEKSADESQTNESETSKESLLAEKEAVSDSDDIVENPTIQCPTIVIESDDEQPTRRSSSASVGSVKQEQGEDLLSEEEEESAQSSTIPVKEECMEDLPVDEDVELKSDTRPVPSSEPEANEQPKKLADDDPEESLLTPKDEEETQQGSPNVREVINVESDSEQEEEADGYLSARGDLEIDTESEEEASAATEKEDAERSSSVKELDTESDSGEEEPVVPVAVKGDLDIGTEIAEEDDESPLLVKASETENAEQSSSVKELDVEAESGEEIAEEDVDSSLSIKASETGDAERSPDSGEEEAAENRSVKEDLDNDTESEEDVAADADPALPIKEDISVKDPATTKDLDEETVSAEENISLPLKKDLDEDTESAQEALSLSIKKDLEEDSESEAEQETETRTAVRSTSAEKDLKINADECEEERSPNNDAKTRDGLASDEEFDAKASPQSSRKSSVAESSDSEDSVTLTMDVDHPCSEDEAADARPGVVKIESDSEEGQQMEMEESLKSTNPAAAPSPIPDVDVAPQVKVNGIHDATIPEDNVKEELEEHDQLSVISNHTANEDDEDEGERERGEDVEEASTSQQLPLRARPLVLPVRRSRSRSTSRSSTISSASQHQLVIDHPAESEQNNGKVQALKLSLKRRRSSRQSISSAASANSVSQPEKQMKKINASTSLLLQRLQGNDGSNVNADSASKPPASSNQHHEHQEKRKQEPEPKKERFYRCAKCGTVHQSWNFFAHVRDVHQKFVCMYCSLTYATVEKLSLHLENKHDIDQKHFPKGAWAVEQQKDDRIRYLICCTCQTTFTQGLDFESHDCAELMVPCAQCGVKGCHAMACRNQKKKPPKRRRRVRKQQTDQQAVPMEPQQEALQTEPAENIPAPMPNWPTIDPGTVPVPTPSPPPAIPKLVVPKIMLRVPKEFQKSVDAALSSTDTEEEEPELQTAAPPERQAETNPSPSPQTPPPAPPQSRPSLDDSDCALMMSRMQAEVERTEMEILRIKADRKPDRKKQSKAIAPAAALDDGLLPPHAAEAMEEPLLQAQEQQVQPQQQEEQRRWSLTPPASPHNTTQPPPAIISEFQADQADAADEDASPGRRNSLGSDCMDIDDSLNGPTAANEAQFEAPEVPMPDQLDAVGLLEAIQPVPESPAPPFDGILVAGEDTHTIDLQLNRPLDRFTIVEFVRLCLTAVYPICLYCNHARRIAVNGKQLVLHLIGQHRFTATVDSITAEELYAETIVARLKSFVPQLEEEFLNMSTYCTLESDKYAEDFNERIFECFSCRYVAATHKELYTHNRRMHAKANIMCIMCRTNFYSYSEILCHICPGEEARSVYDLKFRCCLCASAPPLPSAFRLMVHLRKQHSACDICLEDCSTQARLSAHVWKHKLLHLCYRCGIAYRNKQDISKHLFWKHGTESATCKRCLQKRWPHVYHFCVPPVTFPCEDCGFSFSKAIYLEVHKRMHSGDFRYACAEELCEEKFVSRKLLLKHASTHEAKEDVNPETTMPEPEQKEDSQPLEQAIKKETEEGEGEGTSQQEAETKATPFEEKETKTECTKVEADEKKETGAEPPAAKSETRKRRKKSKRNKEYLEDLNLIAPNLSESDSSDSSDSDAPPRKSGSHGHETLPMRSTVEDLGMPKVMLSPSSESDADDQKSQPSQKPQEPLEGGEEKPSAESEDQAEETPKAETEADAEANVCAELQVAKKEEQPDDVSDMWKNLLQNQTVNPNSEEELPAEEEAPPAELENPPPPSKVHVAWSDHDYCKMYRTPAPSPVKKHSTSKASHAGKRSGKNNASSDSDSSSSSSSNSDSDSSSCSCGSNCSCSSSNSSSSSDDSDDSDSSNAAASPTKRMRKKSLKQKKNEATGKQMPQPDPEEEINVTSAPEEQPVPPPPSPKAPLYNESDFDTAFSDTDEEFYDAHPQKLASELLAQKREALLAEHPPVGPRNNYDIVENSRPSTPSLPEEAAAYADKPERVRNKKKKRERKSTCKSGKLQLLASTPLPAMEPPSIASQMLPAESPSMLPVTPLTHRHLQPGGFLGLGSRMSEGSSCSDADGQLKRSKRQRRPNKFYGYTSDDENMSTILAPPLLVGMQLIKPQPPPLLTWAKEDLPTPPKQRSRNNNNSSSHHHSHLHSNGGMRTPPTGSGSRKRNRQRSQAASGGGSSVSARSAKRHKPHRQEEEKSLPPIPTLKIRPSLLPTSTPPSDSSDSSSEDEEVNVTSLGPPTPQIQMPPALAMPTAPPVVVPVQLPPPPPPPPAATAFNQPIPPALLPNPDFATLQYFKANNIRYPIRPPAGARLAREGESVYCYCRCPYDEVSEMIACDGDNCLIEWFHFECVGIMVAPQGRWFCAECRPKYSEGLYPSATAQ